ncbi:MAG: S8 family peptidase [Chitinophagales bacterium]|nr:S8 family peptidase [Chitinophagales bacterium]
MKFALRFFFSLVVLFTYATSFSQDNYYWVKFTDKQNNNHTIANPSTFLTAASIERRQIQNIAVNESDLPITESYIDSLAPYIVELKHRLKWFNMAVVKLINETYTDSIIKFPFVDTLGKIEFPPSRATDADSKFEEVYPLVNQNYVYPNKYGIAYHQAKMLNTDLLHQLNERGKGVLVAVMDNGFVNVNNIKGFDSVRSRILATYDFVNNETNVYNDGGHGTNVFSCIAGNIPNQFLGTAPDASFFLLTTEDNGREWVMEEYNWAAAAEWADSAGAKIFTTSLGYTTFNGDTGNHTYNDLDGNTTIITRAGNMAFGKGILVLNSAGNEGSAPWHYISAPADGDSILAVGAVDSAELIAGFSGRGPTVNGKIKPDVCAQGVKSAVLTVGGDVGYSGGTSFSCPIMAGSAASLWGAFPDKTANDIKVAIIVSCPTFWYPDNEYGYGIPNFYTAYWLLKTDYNQNILKVTDDVIVYPNPFTNELNMILYGGKEDKTHLFEIFDMAGRKVFEKQIFIRDHTFELLQAEEARNLAAGKYILRLNRNKNYSHVIIKGK